MKSEVENDLVYLMRALHLPICSCRNVRQCNQLDGAVHLNYLLSVSNACFM